MKRIVSILLGIALMVSFVGCGSTQRNKKEETKETVNLDNAEAWIKDSLQEKYEEEFEVYGIEKYTGSYLTTDVVAYQGDVHPVGDSRKIFTAIVYGDGEVADNYASCLYYDEVAELIAPILEDQCIEEYTIDVWSVVVSEKNWKGVPLEDFLDGENNKVIIEMTISDDATAAEVYDVCAAIEQQLKYTEFGVTYLGVAGISINSAKDEVNLFDIEEQMEDIKEYKEGE